MQSNIDTWLRQKSKNDAIYRKNLEIIRNSDLELRYNSRNDIIALVGYIFDHNGYLKKVNTVSRSTRTSEDEQYMDDLIDHFQ